MNDSLILYTQKQELLAQWQQSLQSLMHAPPIVPAQSPQALNSALNHFAHPIIIFHHQSSAEDKVIDHLLKIKKDVLILENIPNNTSGLAWLEKGAKGYLNTHARAERLQQAVNSILTGHVWVGQQLLQTMIQMLHQKETSLEKAPNDSPSWQQALTEREIETVQHVLKGKSNQQIAAALHISERTVKAHLHNIFEKLGVKDRLALALFILGENHESPTNK